MDVPRKNGAADVDRPVVEGSRLGSDVAEINADVDSMNVDVSLAYVGVGCNRVAHALAWSRVSGLIAFGAQNAVAIYDPEGARIIGTLRGHKDQTNAVEWAHPHGDIFSAEDEVLVSGSADGAIIFWNRDTITDKWSQVCEVPNAHRKGVTCLASLSIPFKSFSRRCGAANAEDDRSPDTMGDSSAEVERGGIHGRSCFDYHSSMILVVSASSDSAVRIWQLNLPSPGLVGSGSTSPSTAVTLLQSLSVGVKAMQSVALGLLPTEMKDPPLNDCGDTAKARHGSLLLAAGGLDMHVHLYEASWQDLEFRELCVLKGHQDWIRSVDIVIPALQLPPNRSGEGENLSWPPILVASASQDKNIRIWRITPQEHEKSGKQAGQELSLAMYAAGPLFKLGGRVWQASLESLLVGHEDWVLSVKWQRPQIQVAITPSLGEDGQHVRKVQPTDRLSLLSASMDRTMMIWRPDPASGLWMNEVTVGELGPSNFGFFGGAFSPQGDAILAHGYGGSLHLWKNVRDEEGGTEGDNWVPQIVPSGHFGPIADLCWDKTNSFMVTASKDQTVRIVAQWDHWWRNGGGGGRAGGNVGRGGGGGDKLVKPVVESNTSAGQSWHEIARTQVHGHDMNCVAWIRGSGNHRYVSGADEKVLRVFEAPATFLASLAWTTASKFLDNIKGSGLRALGANMSALGLSQKPIYNMTAAARGGDGELGEYGGSGGVGNDMMDPVPEAVPSAIKSPPLEEHLAQNTLWPETHKLYGHGNDVFCICADHLGRFIATACKAQSAQAAEVWLWDTETWRSVGQLRAHSLTVTQMEFSHSDKYLLCVSRDRQISVFEHKNQEMSNEGGDGHMNFCKPHFELIGPVKAHARIVWSASWTLCDSSFATGSRDKLVKVWRIKGEEDSPTVSKKIECVKVLPPCSSGVTAVAWSAAMPAGHMSLESAGSRVGHHLLAVGLESGDIQIWMGQSDTTNGSMSLTLACQVNFFSCHVAAVQRLCWREGPPRSDGNEDTPRTPPFTIQLASCSADHSLRLFDVRIC